MMQFLNNGKRQGQSRNDTVDRTCYDEDRDKIAFQPVLYCMYKRHYWCEESEVLIVLTKK